MGFRVLLAALAVVTLSGVSAEAGDPLCNRYKSGARRDLCHCRTEMGGSARLVGRSVRVTGTKQRQVPAIYECTMARKARRMA